MLHHLHQQEDLNLKEQKSTVSEQRTFYQIDFNKKMKQILFYKQVDLLFPHIRRDTKMLVKKKKGIYEIAEKEERNTIRA